MVRSALALGVAVSVLGCASASTRIGQAVVSEVNGLPCFAIAPTELSRVSAGGTYPVWGVNVERRAATGSEQVWQFFVGIGAAPVSISNESCIPYGHGTGDSPATGSPGLLPNVVHTVSIQSKNRSSSDPTSAYMAAFCVKVDDKARSLIQQVPLRSRRCD